MELPCGSSTTFGISSPFGLLSPSQRQVVYALLTRLPLDFQKQAFNRLVRLACVKHAASVRPEPGSNSPFKRAVSALALTDILATCRQANSLHSFLKSRYGSQLSFGTLLHY